MTLVTGVAFPGADFYAHLRVPGVQSFVADDVDLGKAAPAPSASTSVIKATVANTMGAIYRNDPGGRWKELNPPREPH